MSFQCIPNISYTGAINFYFLQSNAYVFTLISVCKLRMIFISIDGMLKLQLTFICHMLQDSFIRIRSEQKGFIYYNYINNQIKSVCIIYVYLLLLYFFYITFIFIFIFISYFTVYVYTKRIYTYTSYTKEIEFISTEIVLNKRHYILNILCDSYYAIFHFNMPCEYVEISIK